VKRSQTWAVFAGIFGALVGALVYLVWRPAPSAPLFGFTAATAAAERRLERAWRRSVSPDRLRDAHRVLAGRPHLAGSPRDRELAEWVRDRWIAAGLEDVRITEHEVLLPWAEEVAVEMTAPRPWRATMAEDPVPGDEYSAALDVGIPYHAYSRSGEVEAEVVYAASGNPEHYDWLAARGIDVRGKIVLVRYSVPYSYRGFKALTAQQRGAAGLLIYSDPADDGAGKGKVYPEGPWGPESHIQRGAIVYDFLVPGDPLTPGWPSVPGARRIAPAEAVSLPAIMSAPLSARDARVILEALGGPEAPQAWQGGLGFTYRAGPGPARVRLKVRLDDRVRPIWTVTGVLRGTDRPDEWVIVGNHRDAWIYGGVDPASGSAALMELVDTLGALARGGTRPRRSILFASWDAEEFTLTSSTEWGEEHAAELGARAVAYLNVDSAASGPDFSASAVPSLNRLIEEVAQTVPDPVRRIPIAAAWRTRTASERGALPGARGPALVDNRLGSGSDYTVFLNFLGIPVADLGFDGPYGVYHSVYDNHHWVARIGDPGFRYHAALVQIWGLAALRLANADVVPLDPAPYAARLREFLDERNREWLSRPTAARAPGVPWSPDLRPVVEAIERFERAVATVAAERDRVLAGEGSPAEREALNTRLRMVERAWLDPEGIPGRPWYRHQIYAPKFTYAPEVLPGLAAAIASGESERVRHEARRLAAAVDRATAVLLSQRPSP
jgi:N-acetylated-alpha-linked acidic dipeptidase